MNFSHDLRFVTLAVALACLASYTAIDIAGHVTAARARRRAVWLAGGSLALGAGIWSMHFIAMLGMRVHAPIRYQGPLLLASGAIAVAASALALHTVSRAHVTRATLTAGSLLMGAAIVGMHYVGMAAIRTPGGLAYDAAWVAASVAIAIVASGLGLGLAYRFRDQRPDRVWWHQAAGGVVIGIAISSMHFTAMRAVRFAGLTEAPHAPDLGLLRNAGLATGVGLTTLIIFGIALWSGAVDRRARMFSEQILESITDAFFAVGPDWRFTYVNRQAERLLRRERRELLGRTMWDHLPRGARPEFERCLHLGDRGGGSAPFEVHDAEQGLWIEAHAYPAAGGLSVFFRDISVKKRAELEREALLERERQARRDAEAAIGTRDEVLAVVSHDLRNPLNVIVTSAALLELPIPAEKKAEQVQLIQRVARRMAALIQDLLDVTRIETGHFSVEVQPTPAGSLLREVQESFAAEAEGKRQRLVVEAPEPLPAVEADRDRVLQVLGNLVGNAVKFTGEGGEIRVRAHLDGERVHFAVHDTGPGISAEDLAHIFERFWQARRVRRGGAGLGLAIAKGIVAAHGEQIWAESTLGVGTTFYFSLRVARPAPDEQPEAGAGWRAPRVQPGLA